MDNILAFPTVSNGQAEVRVRLGPRLRAEIQRRIVELEKLGHLTAIERQELSGLRQLLTIPEREKEPAR